MVQYIFFTEEVIVFSSITPINKIKFSKLSAESVEEATSSSSVEEFQANLGSFQKKQCPNKKKQVGKRTPTDVE